MWRYYDMFMARLEYLSMWEWFALLMGVLVVGAMWLRGFGSRKGY